MFKILVIQRLTLFPMNTPNVSSLTGCCLCGFWDWARTIGPFREKLMSGQTIDASLVAAPRQRNTDDRRSAGGCEAMATTRPGLGISLYCQEAGEGPVHLAIAGRRGDRISALQLAYMLDRIDWRNPVHLSDRSV
jgi:hypothetical protein